jgi:signal transduction histidine kinase
MTLRQRFLLLYGIVVLLSAATVGVAIFELRHAQQVLGALQHWDEVALTAERLHAALKDGPADSADIQDRVLNQYRLLSPDPTLQWGTEYVDVDRPRAALNNLKLKYQEWLKLPAAERQARLADLTEASDAYARFVDGELSNIQQQVGGQDFRRVTLVAVVIGLALVHVIVLGALLRRWLVEPMEQLDRQVAALARDEPPGEPLLTSPREIANLARALDRARESLGSLRQQLIEAERLTTIGQIAAQLAHNLRNPLASIRAAAQMVLRRVQADADARGRMQEIMASVDRLNQWIAGLMEVARREPTATQSLDVVPTLERVREGLRLELGAKELSLAVDVPAEGLVCSHDPPTLEHALLAMVVNAIEASPLGGQIAIRGEYERRDGRRVCRIAVEDGGTGLPRDCPERIFEFSYSTKQRGMGLGLALARQALERQGGSAHAVNKASGGATVYVELPVMASDGEMLPPGAAATQAGGAFTAIGTAAKPTGRS